RLLCHQRRNLVDLEGVFRGERRLFACERDGTLIAVFVDRTLAKSDACQEPCAFILVILANRAGASSLCSVVDTLELGLDLLGVRTLHADKKASRAIDRVHHLELLAMLRSGRGIKSIKVEYVYSGGLCHVCASKKKAT